jgi:hypothetical protein
MIGPWWRENRDAIAFFALGSGVTTFGMEIHQWRTKLNGYLVFKEAINKRFHLNRVSRAGAMMMMKLGSRPACPDGLAPPPHFTHFESSPVRSSQLHHFSCNPLPSHIVTGFI